VSTSINDFKGEDTTMTIIKHPLALLAGLVILLAACADATAGGFVITPLGGFVRGPRGFFAFSPLGIAGRRNPVCIPAGGYQMAPMGYSAYQATGYQLAPMGYAAPQVAGYQVAPMAAPSVQPAYVQNVPMYSYPNGQDAAYAQAQSSIGLVRDIWELVREIRGDLGIGGGGGGSGLERRVGQLERDVDRLEERIERLEDDDGRDDRDSRNSRARENEDLPFAAAQSAPPGDEANRRLIADIAARAFEIEQQKIELERDIKSFRLMSEMINERLGKLEQ
jgi:hypothetical protein